VGLELVVVEPVFVTVGLELVVVETTVVTLGLEELVSDMLGLEVYVALVLVL
jgi:hypothetical protein